ncbi:unnamed protein product [Cuscuta epithymum]|uniref:Phosphoglycolate phosphatase n=1 Tax=Cuscuta epithymum TaxID=186058 RepID=A0AAV0DRH9_9ASTE|nr:unnamed protein product [Cuscuta epithymum]
MQGFAAYTRTGSICSLLTGSMNCEVADSTVKLSSSSYQRLSSHNFLVLLDSVDAFLFDCDGVIWKGDKLIDGIPETLHMLRSNGKKLVFVTNNSTKSRKLFSKKFHTLGIPVSEDEIFSSSFAAAMYLNVHNFPEDKKVSKGVMSCATQEVKDLYHVLENEFLPLDLALKAQPLLIKISKLGGLTVISFFCS